MVRTVNYQLTTAITRVYPFHCASIAPVDTGINALFCAIPKMVRRYSRSVFSNEPTFGAGFTLFGVKKVNGLLPVFSSVQSSWYWSSTTNVNNTDNAWIVNLNNGNVNNDNKTNTNYVWPVRAGK